MTTCVVLYQNPLPLPTPIFQPRTDDELKCMGVGLTLQQWKDYWADTTKPVSCNTMFNRLIYPPNQQGVRTFSPAGFSQARNDMEYIFSQYFSVTGPKGGHTIGVPGQAGYDDFQQVLIDACTNPAYQNQGICQDTAAKMCVVCSRENVLNNSSVLKLCGCQVPPLDPAKFGGVTRECDPLCAQAQISKIRNPTTGVVAECQASVCVINNVSITASKSTIGGITFTQVCPQCTGTQQCRCVVDTSIPNIAESVGIADPQSFSQYCGANSVCLTVDNTSGNVSQVDCATAIKPAQPRTFSFPIPTWVLYLAALIIVIGILVIVSAMYSSQNLPSTTTTAVTTSSSSLPTLSLQSVDTSTK